MDNKLMIFECMECRETYLADNLCDGCRCPECDGGIKPLGFLGDIENDIEVMRSKIDRAKHNGLIREVHKKKNYICGVDLGNGKDSTVFTIHVNIDQTKEIKDLIETFNNFKRTKRAGVIE